jgi:hypothetical protein
LVTGFIDRLLVVTANKYTTIATSTIYTHTCPQSITVPTIRFLVTVSKTGIITVSLNYTLQISLYYSTHKVFSSQPNSFLLIFIDNPQLTLSIPQSTSTIDSQLNSLPSLLNYQLSWPGILVIETRGGPNRKHRLQQYFYCWALLRKRVCRAVA